MILVVFSVTNRDLNTMAKFFINHLYVPFEDLNFKSSRFNFFPIWLFIIAIFLLA